MKIKDEAVHAALQRWRDEDHEDTVALSREQVIDLCEEYRAAITAKPEAVKGEHKLFEDFGVEYDDDCYVIRWESNDGRMDSLTAFKTGKIILTRSPFSGDFPPKSYTFDSLIAAQADYERRIMSALTAAPVGVTPTHRHKKRGTEYVLIGYGKMQTESWVTDCGMDWSENVDMREVAIYQSLDDGEFWVRPREEFEDGRFEVLASLEPAPEPGEFGDGVTVEREDDSVVAKNATTASADKVEVVAYMHPTAKWAHHRITEVLPHCKTDGSDGGPQPLVRQSALTACQQDVERLMGELIKSRNYWSGQCSDMIQRNAELVKALEPFANAKITYLDAPDGREVKAKHVHGLVYGDFRRARAALGGQSNEA